MHELILLKKLVEISAIKTSSYDAILRESIKQTSDEKTNTREVYERSMKV
jgi:hypothetical protein